MALFLDFDGTLAPLQDDAQAVRLPEGADAVLLGLQAALGYGPALISGRDLDDLSARVPAALERIGNHGLRRAMAGQTETAMQFAPPDALVDPLSAILVQHPGSFAEPKGRVIAVHYRQTPDSADALSEALSSLPLSEHGYALESGKMIYELKPEGASKGAALAKIMAEHADLIPVMIGDDTTDEAAMIAAQRLGGIGVKVGAGDSAAQIRLDSVDAVHDLLRSWLTQADDMTRTRP